MRLCFASLLLCLILGQASRAFAKDSATEVKRDCLHQLQDLRTANVKRMRELDEALVKKIELKTSASLVAEVTTLKAEKREHVLRQEVLDRLILQVDTKYTTGDLRTFLENSLMDLAKIDATSSSTADGQLWPFFKYAAEAVHRLPEQKENVVAFLEGYMKRSVSNPVLPDEFIQSRNYSNGAKSESGHPVSREQVGALADERIQKLGSAANEPAVLH